MNKFDEIVSSLSSLSVNELVVVRDKASVLIALSPHQKEKENGFIASLYTETARALNRETSERCVPFSVFEKRELYKKVFLPAAKLAQEFNDRNFPKQQRRQREIMIALYVRLAISFVKKTHSTLNWYGVSHAFKNLSAVIDHAFPGYARSGLLHMLAEKETQQ